MPLVGEICPCCGKCGEKPCTPSLSARRSPVLHCFYDSPQLCASSCAEVVWQEVPVRSAKAASCLQTSASLPSCVARTQLTRLLLGIDNCFAALPIDMPVVFASLTASAQNRPISSLRCPFHSPPPNRQITRSGGLCCFQPTQPLSL